MVWRRDWKGLRMEMGNMRKVSCFSRQEERKLSKVYFTKCNKDLNPPPLCQRVTSPRSFTVANSKTGYEVKKANSELLLEWPYIPIFKEVLIYAYCSKVIINSVPFHSQKCPIRGDKFWGHSSYNQRTVGVLKNALNSERKDGKSSQEEVALKQLLKDQCDSWRPSQTKGTAQA